MSLGIDDFLGKPDSIPYFLGAMAPFGMVCVFLGLSGLLPESPRHVFMTLGDPERARKALKQLNFSECQIVDTINGMQLELAEDAKHHIDSQKDSSVRILANDNIARHAFVAALLINICQSLTIYYPMLSYSTVMLKDFGATTSKAQWFTSAIGVADIVSALACPWVVNAIPRRIAFIGNLLGMTLCAVVMWVSGAILYSDTSLHYEHKDTVLCSFVVAALTLTVLFSFGPGPISMFIPAEISPQHTRSLTVSISKTTRWLVIAVGSQLYYGLLVNWGPHSFAPYVILSSLCTIGVVYTMPESQARSLPEMWAHLDEKQKNQNKKIRKGEYKE